MQELRYAVRRLRRQAGATWAAIGTLACAIGAATTTWAIVSATVLDPVPGASTAGWYVVHAGQPGADARLDFTYPALHAVAEAEAFDEVAAAWTSVERLLLTRQDAASLVRAAFVTHQLLPGLGVPMQRGRGFAAADDRRGAVPVAVLTDRGWKQAFGGDPTIVGQTVRVGRASVTIVGVASAPFRGLDLTAVPDLYLPLHVVGEVSSPLTNYFADPSHENSPTSGVRIFGRLPAGTVTAPAVARLATAAANAAPGTFGGPHGAIGVMPVEAAVLAGVSRAGLPTFARLLSLTVAALLLVGCAAVALLLFVRVESRRAEFATRLALGGSRSRLVRGLALEAAIVAGAGATLAVPVAWWLLGAVRGFRLPGGVALSALGVDVDGQVLAAAALAGALACLVITAVTTLHAAVRAAGAEVLTPSAAPASFGRRALRDGLLAGQVAVAVVLVAGALVFVGSLRAALALNPRVDMRTVLRTELNLRRHGYDPDRAAWLFDAWRARLAAHPAIGAIGFSVDAGGMTPRGRLAVDGMPRSFPTTVDAVAIDPHYFDAMRLRVTTGRDFARTDGRGAQRVTVVSASMARHLGGERGAVGRRIEMPWGGAPHPVATVIGVVPDVVTEVTVLQPLVLYVPMAQAEAATYRTVAIRPAGSVDPVAPAVRAALRDIDATVLPPVVTTLQEGIARQMSPQQLGSAVLGALGVMALILTVLSVYVLADAMATFRMRELGIRSALGATGRSLIRLLLTETLRPVALGIALGIGVSVAGARLVRVFAFHVEPLDPLRFAGIAGVLLALALLASLRPAIGASRLDVARTLRNL